MIHRFFTYRLSSVLIKQVHHIYTHRCRTRYRSQSYKIPANQSNRIINFLEQPLQQAFAIDNPHYPFEFDESQRNNMARKLQIFKEKHYICTKLKAQKRMDEPRLYIIANNKSIVDKVKFENIRQSCQIKNSRP